MAGADRPPLFIQAGRPCHLSEWLAHEELSGHAVQHVRRDVEVLDRVVVQDADAVGGDSPHRQLFMTGYAEFTDQ